MHSTPLIFKIHFQWIFPVPKKTCENCHVPTPRCDWAVEPPPSLAFPSLAKSWQAPRLDTKPAVSWQFSLVLSLSIIMENMLLTFEDVTRRKDQAG